MKNWGSGRRQTSRKIAFKAVVTLVVHTAKRMGEGELHRSNTLTAIPWIGSLDSVSNTAREALTPTSHLSICLTYMMTQIKALLDFFHPDIPLGYTGQLRYTKHAYVNSELAKTSENCFEFLLINGCSFWYFSIVSFSDTLYYNNHKITSLALQRKQSIIC